MNMNRPYVGDLSSPTLDYLWWVAERINPKDHEAGFREAVAEWRKEHPLILPPTTPVDAAKTPYPHPTRADRPA